MSRLKAREQHLFDGNLRCFKTTNTKRVLNSQNQLNQVEFIGTDDGQYILNKNNNF